jgi:hypothetical protein
VPYTARLTTLRDVSIPGDITSGTQAITGPYRVFQPHEGTVIFEAGRVVLAGDGSFVSDSGPHPFADYFELGDTTALQPLGEALQ